VTLVHSSAVDEPCDPLLHQLPPTCATVLSASRPALSSLVARFHAEGVVCEALDNCEPLSVALAREVNERRAELAPCEELEIDLAVLGAVSDRHDDPGQIGSTTERVVLRSSASLLLVRSR